MSPGHWLNVGGSVSMVKYNCKTNYNRTVKVSNRLFGTRDFPQFETRDSAFESKIGAGFGIESIHRG